MPEAEFCVLFEKPTEYKINSVYSVVKLPRESPWVVFPWESKH